MTQILNPTLILDCEGPRGCTDPPIPVPSTAQQLQTNLCLPQHLLGLLQGMADEHIPNLVGNQVGISIIQQHEVITGIFQILELLLFAKTQREAVNDCKLFQWTLCHRWMRNSGKLDFGNKPHPPQGYPRDQFQSWNSAIPFRRNS